MQKGFIITHITKANGRWLFSDIDTTTTPIGIMWCEQFDNAYVFDSYDQAYQAYLDLIIPRENIKIIDIQDRHTGGYLD